MPRVDTKTLSDIEEIRYNRDGTFSFRSSSSKAIRIKLDSDGIKYLGGLSTLRVFLEEIKSGKRKLKMSNRTRKMLESTVSWNTILR